MTAFRARVVGALMLGFGLVALAGPTSSLAADKYKDADEAYQKLLKKAQEKPPKPTSVSRFSTKNQRYEVVSEVPTLQPIPASPGVNENRPVALAVKVWAELVAADGVTGTGQFVNLEKYRWSPEQRFYLWFESATPIQVALYQHYLADTAAKPARLVLPNPSYPTSYSTLTAGQAVKYPILLKTDPDLKKELMSIVAYTPGSPLVEQKPLAINTLTSTSTSTQIQTAMTQTSQQLETAMNQSVQVQVNQQTNQVTVINPDGDNIPLSRSTRFDAVAPTQATAPSTTANDVATILLGAGNVAHTQIELHK